MRFKNVFASKEIEANPDFIRLIFVCFVFSHTSFVALFVKFASNNSL